MVWHSKDLNKNGSLDKYEDWRLPVDERAKDLASKMSVEQIAGPNVIQWSSVHSSAAAWIWKWKLTMENHNRREWRPYLLIFPISQKEIFNGR